GVRAPGPRAASTSALSLLWSFAGSRLMLSDTVVLSPWWRSVERVKQIAEGKRCEPENSTPEIEVMTRAKFESPLHRRKQMKRLADMSKNDDHQTSGTEQLQERGQCLSS